jgi:hypothetical protein
MVCDVERDELGGEHSRSKDGSEFYYLNYNQNDQSDRSPVSMWDLASEGTNGTVTLARVGMVRGHKVAMEEGYDGNPKPVRLTYKSMVYGGCPFCGTVNWRGDF